MLRSENERRRPEGHSSRGFSLVELLVVIAIISLLVALLLPSVQQCREAARLVGCQNNLPQIGLALSNYMMAHEVLPPGTQNDIGPIQSIESGRDHMSWLTQILPHLDEKNAYDSIDFTKPVYDPINRTARHHRISTLICPSTHQSYGLAGAPTTYFGVHNDFETLIDVNQNGVLFLNSSIRRDDIHDGESHTMYVMESATFLIADLGWMSGTRSSLRNAVIRIPAAPSANEVMPKTDKEPTYRFRVVGHRDIEWDSARAEVFDESGNEIVGGPGSGHGSKFNVVMGDGAVRAISTSIDPKMLRNLAHRADGEMMNDVVPDVKQSTLRHVGF